jgi:hypothetical protein
MAGWVSRIGAPGLDAGRLVSSGGRGAGRRWVRRTPTGDGGRGPEGAGRWTIWTPAGPGAPGIRRRGWGRPVGQPGADRTPRPANPPPACGWVPAQAVARSAAVAAPLRRGALACCGGGLLRWGSAAVGVCCGGAAPRSGSTGERQRLPGAGRWGELAVRGLSRGDCDRAVWTLPSAWDFFLPQREGRARGGPGRVWAARLTGSGAARPPAPSGQ